MEHLSSPTNAVTYRFFSSFFGRLKIVGEIEIINDVRNFEYLLCVCLTIQN